MNEKKKMYMYYIENNNYNIYILYCITYGVRLPVSVPIILCKKDFFHSRKCSVVSYIFI